MRKIIWLLALIILVSCHREIKKPDRPVVAVSILPQKYMVSAIADTLLDVVVMVPPGASPATWEATPAQMKQLSFAQAYFRIGHIGFEKAWMKKMKELNDSMKVINLAADLDLISINTQHGDHSHTGVDPHVWMSPSNMEKMARKVYYELKALFPDYSDQFRKNYEGLFGEIKMTKANVDGILSKHGGKAFLIFHPSLGYLAKDYYLKQIPIEFEGKEPSPAHLKEVIDEARTRGINTVFVQAEFDMRNANIIAEELQGHVVRIDPLAENWNEEIKRIAKMLDNNLR